MSLLKDLIQEGYRHNRDNVNDLLSFIHDNDDLYSVMQRLGLKGANEVAWRRLADRAAKRLAKEVHDDESMWNRLFSVDDRHRAAIELASHAKEMSKMTPEESELKNQDNYNDSENYDDSPDLNDYQDIVGDTNHDDYY